MKIAHVFRNHPRFLHARMIGWWSEPTSAFEVTDFCFPKRITIDRSRFSQFDAIVWEDGRCQWEWVNSGPPLVYTVCDSTLSDEHFEHRLQQAQFADMVLLDWDSVSRWQRHLNVPVAQWRHCPSYRFQPKDKTVDVGFFFHETPERVKLSDLLAGFCIGHGLSYSSGKRVGDDYIASLATCRVAVNLNRNPKTRAHRCYDAMASGAALLTSENPPVEGEDWIDGVHYLSFHFKNYEERLISILNESDRFSRAGLEWINNGNRWSHRSAELKTLIQNHLGAMT